MPCMEPEACNSAVGWHLEQTNNQSIFGGNNFYGVSLEFRQLDSATNSILHLKYLVGS